MKTKGKKYFLKYKFYRRYVTDLWGSLTKRRKRNTTLRAITKRLIPLIKRKIRRIPIRSKRKSMYIKFALRKKYFNPNKIFNLSKVSKESRKLRIKRLRYRGLLLAMKKKLRVYYGLKLKVRKLRKLSFNVKVKTKKYFSRILESRIDSLLIRSNFADTISEARQLVNAGKVRILVPRINNRLSWLVLKNPSHKLSSYTPLELIDILKKKRKNYLFKLLISNKFCNYPASYLYVNFNLMHSFTTTKLTDEKVKYNFPANLSYFSGLTKYF